QQFFFLITTQNGFRRLSDCIIGDENIPDRAAHVSQNSEIRLIKTENLFTIVVDSENSKCAETTPLSNQFANVFNVAGENLNYELAFKIEQNICRFKQNNLEKRPKQTCSMKEDLNLIILIDISIQSREYYRSYYTVIIQEIIRAFEFKWDELNLNNERLKSRIQVFGIKKPRRIIQKIKLFDTIDFSTPLENSSAKLENLLNSAELAIMNPQITQSSGMTPKADDVVAFLRKFYEVEKRKVANVKIVHLQNTDLNKIEEKRQRRSTFESDQTDFSRQILIATSDTNFQDFKRSHFLDIINIKSVNSTFLGKYFKDVWSTIDQINKFICEKETEIAFSDSSRCYAALDTFESQRFEYLKSESTICQKTKTQLQIERNYCERNKNELFYEKISSENELESCKLKHDESEKIRVKQESKILDLENAQKKLTELVSDLESELKTLKREKSDVFILVIPYRVDRSYMQSSDGSSQISATINVPGNNYAENAAHALVNGKLHIFGGYSDGTKIARLDDCTLNELTVRLNEERKYGHAALSIENGKKALICFGVSGEIRKTCEIFDDSTTVSTFASDSTHRHGGLGLYKNQPASVGCGSEQHQKAETLSATGWIALPNHPKLIYYHSLVGLENHSMLLIGGQDWGNGCADQSGIWQLKDENWNQIGELLQAEYWGSAIYIGRSIYHFGYTSKAIQRLDFNETEELQNVAQIGKSTRRLLFCLFCCKQFLITVFEMKSESTICQKTKTQLQIERNYCERNKNELFYEKISSENELESCKLKHDESEKIRVKQESKILDLENAKKKLTELVSDLESELKTLKREKVVNFFYLFFLKFKLRALFLFLSFRIESTKVICKAATDLRKFQRQLTRREMIML
ncbi:unnamed protein product, partial [Oikopleura dioica]